MSGYKILIVEDEASNSDLLEIILKKYGYQITGIVPGSEEAISHIRKNKPDLVLMDIEIEGEMNGIDTAKVIQDDFRIPVIFLSALTDEETFKRVEKANASGYIMKPFKSPLIQAALKIVISSHVRERE